MCVHTADALSLGKKRILLTSRRSVSVCKTV